MGLELGKEAVMRSLIFTSLKQKPSHEVANFLRTDGMTLSFNLGNTPVIISTIS